MDVITFPENQLSTSDLQILLHDVISLPDATSCNNNYNDKNNHDNNAFCFHYMKLICPEIG